MSLIELLIGNLDLLMFPAAIILLLRGFPVAFTLAGVGLIFAVLGALTHTGFFASGDLGFLKALFGRLFGLMDESNEVLVAVPLFVFMGVMLERSGVATELLETMARLFGKWPGGLGLSVAFVGMLLAASTGIVGATVVTMGLVSLPTMLAHRYDKRLATGIIAASGTLGQIIPPSIVLIILGDVLSNSYLEARRSIGDWAPTPMSIGDVFSGALLPGLLLVAFYMAYTLAVALWRPQKAPSAAHLGDNPGLGRMLRILLPPLILIIAVLGSILFGIATPTEAAAIGAVGAILLAGQCLDGKGAMPQIAAVFGAVIVIVAVAAFDLRLVRQTLPLEDQIGIAIAGFGLALVTYGLATSLWQTWQSRDGAIPVLAQAMRTTTKMTAMVFTIYIGAQVFNLAFRGLGGEQTIHHFFSGLPGGPWIALAAVMLVMFFLGFFLDFLEIVFVVTPIMAPVLFAFNDSDGQALFHPVWIAVLMGLNLQTSFLTPPFGFSLFYLRGVAPPEVSTSDIYRGVIPFVLIQIAVLGIVMAWPEMSTWLPTYLSR
ncbi:MAG: TRAP transporter large permease subunit [Hyphomicrobiales bacterium]|nr:TRAP transporter large permease subunit [Hyphomicrobiales bacterium]MCP4999450.1 TRAP transporter large permease subunit [Hyphomicrobiales bacterium]